MQSQRFERSFPIGAEVSPGGGVHFRVWAPKRQRVEVAFEQGETGVHLPAQVLTAESDGDFSGHIADAGAGALYRFRLDDAPNLYPDPASRFQPSGPHGP